jgi:hypothetical protein
MTSSTSLRSHRAGGIVGLSILLILGLLMLLSQAASKNTHQAEMAIEHTSPLTISLDIHSLLRGGVIKISHDGNEIIGVSVPESWDLEEIHGMALTDLQTDPPEFGFTRYHIEKGITLTFVSTKGPDDILLHNPSEIPISIDLTRIDLSKEKTKRRSILIQKSPVSLW